MSVGQVGVRWRKKDALAFTQKAMSSDAFHALKFVGQLYQVELHDFEPDKLISISQQDFLTASSSFGLKAKKISVGPMRLIRAPLPALAVMNDGRVVVLVQCDGQWVLFMEPIGEAVAGNMGHFTKGESARPTIELIEIFSAQWSGDLILVSRRSSLVGQLAELIFPKFIRRVIECRDLLDQMLLASLSVQLFALINFLFIQIAMGKVWMR